MVGVVRKGETELKQLSRLFGFWFVSLSVSLSPSLSLLQLIQLPALLFQILGDGGEVCFPVGMNADPYSVKLSTGILVTWYVFRLFSHSNPSFPSLFVSSLGSSESCVRGAG